MRNGDQAAMAPEELARLWEAWLDGSLAPDEAERLAAALSDPALRTALADDLAVAGGLAALAGRDPEPIVRGFRAEVAARSDGERFVAAFREHGPAARPAPAPRARRPGRAFWWMGAGLAAAAAALALVVGPWPRGPSVARLVDVPGDDASVLRKGRRTRAAAGLALHAGSEVQTGAREITFEYPDRTWFALGPRARTRVDGGPAGAKRLELHEGWLSSDLTDVAGAGAVVIATPHADVEGRAADFQVTVTHDTRVDVWAGEMAVVSRDPVRRLIVRGGQWAVVAPGGPPRLSGTREPVGALARANAPPPAVERGARALTVRPGAGPPPPALAPRPGPPSFAGAAGAPEPEPQGSPALSFEGDAFRPVGTGQWTLLPRGARMTSLNEEYAWDYQRGGINQGLVRLQTDGGARIRARMQVDRSAVGKWDLGLVLHFDFPRTVTCHYAARGPHRLLTLDLHHDHGVAPGWTSERFPRAPGPVSFQETYWMELELRRPPDGPATIDCRMWADGTERPQEPLSVEAELVGPLRRLGLRTYRVAATFEPIEVEGTAVPAR